MQLVLVFHFQYVLQEENARLQAKSESLADQVTSLRHETLTLRTQLDEARVSGMKGDTADNFTNILNTLRADQEKVGPPLYRCLSSPYLPSRHV